MTITREVAQSIDLRLSEKLKDRNYRRKFFLAEASARIAEQLISLRKKRDLNQSELAEKIGTKQPAISRVERADYQNWSFNTLRSIADTLDARIRVTIEPAEEIISEYREADVTHDAQTETAPEESAAAVALFTQQDTPFFQSLMIHTFQDQIIGSLGNYSSLSMAPNIQVFGLQPFSALPFLTVEQARQKACKDETSRQRDVKIKQLEEEVAALRGVLSSALMPTLEDNPLFPVPNYGSIATTRL